MIKIADVLVPTDFSPNAQRAVEFASALIATGGEICLLHVIDAELIEHLVEEGFGDKNALTHQWRAKAEQRMQACLATLPRTSIQVEPMIVVGHPFAEILRIANDLAYGLIVLGRRGRRGADIEEMLFGSTAEKVIRAAQVPVVVVPATWSFAAPEPTTEGATS